MPALFFPASRAKASDAHAYSLLSGAPNAAPGVGAVELPASSSPTRASPTIEPEARSAEMVWRRGNSCDHDGSSGVQESGARRPGVCGFLLRWARTAVPTEEMLSYRQELSGMLGDLGLYIPLVLALSLSGQVSLGATLMFSGLANIITGVTFTVPMCVQPMKSIAAIALSDGLTTPQIMASGILTGAIVGALGLTGLISLVNALIPNSVVRGLQLGLGLNFFKSAISLLPNKGALTWSRHDWLHWDGFLPAALALAFALVYVRSSKVPTALLLFFLGA